MATSQARREHGTFVSESAGGMSGRPVGRRRSVDSIPALVIHPPPFGSTPPRPPRSPNRFRLPDIKEEPSSAPRTGEGDPALQELASLREAVQAFARRLQAIPPPESSAGSRTSSSPSSTLERLRRVRSMSSVGSRDELDRRRAAGSGDGEAGQPYPGHSRGETAETDAGHVAEAASHAVDRSGPIEPLLPPSNGHSPTSPLALGESPLPQPSRNATAGHGETRTAHTNLPTLHVTRPSTSDNSTEVQPFAAVVGMMERGDSPSGRRSRGPSPTPSSASGAATLKGAGPTMVGRSQTPRRGAIGPRGLIAKVKSSSSLSKLKNAATEVHARSRPASLASNSKQSSSNTTFLRPAPLPPPTSSYPARFAHTEYARSSASSPSPSPGPGASFARASPSLHTTNNWSTRNGLGEQSGEMVEIPRFKRKELNLQLVKRRGPGQRIAWIGLWAVWLINGLGGLFFDVNLMYMLVQCTNNTSRGNTGPSRSWAFATAAYAIAWGISTFVVWLGWEVYYEFWRKWRQTRPAIEPIYTSLPASLHLSLWSYTHFTFLVHIRLSSWSTPFRSDILPETAYSLVQLLPGLLPLLPRAGIGIVLLTTFSSSTTRTNKDEQFFASSGSLTSYARGVILAFVSLVALRLLVFIVSAVMLFLTSARLPSMSMSRKNATVDVPSTPKRKRKSSLQPPRDPATTRSPQKTWYEAETSFGWHTWRSRMRSRIQDTYELCMIRRGGTGIGMMVDGSYLVLGAPSASPRPEGGIRLVHRGNDLDGRGSIEELTDQGHADPEKRMTEEAIDEMLGTPTTGSTLLKLSQVRPANPGPSSSQSHSPLSSQTHGNTPIGPGPSIPVRTSSNVSGAGLYAPSSQASHSSHDVFFTPMQGNTPRAGTTPTVEHAGMNLVEPSLVTPTPSSTALRGLADPSRATLPARPESDVMGNEETLEDPRRASHESGTEESITDDSAALLSSTSRRESTTLTDESTSLGRSRSRSITSPSQDGSRPASRDRAVSAVLSRSRAGSLSNVGHTLTRARSSSITLLREGAGAVQGAVRRARSGTSDGNSYTRVDGDATPHTIPRRRSKLALGGVLSPERAIDAEK